MPDSTPTFKVGDRVEHATVKGGGVVLSVGKNNNLFPVQNP